MLCWVPGAAGIFATQGKTHVAWVTNIEAKELRVAVDLAQSERC